MNTPVTANTTKNNLKRLPLPVFNGNKTEYLRFKKNFKEHVTYESESDKVLALQQECLKHGSDRKRIANFNTLQECWDALDNIYGNIDVLEASIYTKWKSLKSPATDQQFLNFAAEIENGISLLDSLQKENEKTYNPSMALDIEKKLPEKMLNEYYDEYTADESPKVRMTNLLNFLKKKKKSVQWKISTYSLNDKKEDSDPSMVTSQASGIDANSRGGSRGRGQVRGRGGGRGRGAGRGKSDEQAGAEL